jgi:hypothetical protein
VGLEPAYAEFVTMTSGPVALRIAIVDRLSPISSAKWQVLGDRDLMSVRAWQDVTEVFFRTANIPDEFPFEALRVDWRAQRAWLALANPAGALLKQGPVNVDRPVLDIIVARWLARNMRGVVFHGCCLKTTAGGLLFLGPSGAGKSTLARLWQETGADVTVLSDECVILCDENDDYICYGTPWGGVNVKTPFSADRSRIRATFVLAHGLSNTITPMSMSEAGVRVLKEMNYVRGYGANHEQWLFDFAEGLCLSAPICLLRFKPDHDVVADVERYLDVVDRQV